MASGFTNSTYRIDDREFLEIKYDGLQQGLAGYWQRGEVTIPVLPDDDSAKLTYSGQLYSKTFITVTGNDYAETRLCLDEEADRIEPGDLVCEKGDDLIGLCHEHLNTTAMVVSDTYGFCAGERGRRHIPIAVCGRVLVKPKYSRDQYRIGDPVCADDGGVVVMDRHLIALYPDALIGTVVSIPKYETWNGVSVNGRIWIKVR